MDMLWLDGVGHVQVLAFRVNVGLLGVIKVHDFVHHTVSCESRVGLFYLGLTMVCLIFRIVGRFANWVFRQDFFFFDICKVKLRAVSFLLLNWLLFSLSWLSLMLFLLDLALCWSCALLDWLFMTLDWLGTMLNGLRLTLSLLRLVFDWLGLVFGGLILSLFLSRLRLGGLHGGSRRDRVQSSMLWLIIFIIVDWLFMLVVLMSHHGSWMVRNGTVNYGRVPCMAAILDNSWVYVVSRLICIRMIHLSNLLVIIVRRDT